jgi:large subunit ribosomal protein L3
MTVQGLIGQKLGMSQIYGENGKIVPVTVIAAGPCRVVLKKTKERDGYEAVQLSFLEVPEKKLPKAERGHLKKANVPFAKHLREFKGDLKALEVGAVIGADQFQKGELVDVTGTSKGKGFAGVVKLHHFAGGPATHGSMFHRQPGSIGSSSWPSRVRKNKRLPAHMGNEQVTVQGLEVVDVRKDENLLFIRGAVPGFKGAIVLIKRSTRK